MNDPCPWQTPPKTPQFAPDEVHVWRAGDDHLGRDFESVRLLLDREEQERADQFKFDHDRRRFIFCRGALRQLLARYTGRPPTEIAFALGPYGKPSLAGGSSGVCSAPLHFNVSHTRGLALFAFSNTLSVGIDVEAIDPAHDWETIGRRFFHSGEWAFLESQPRSIRAQAGYTIWTCKEAYLKASGDGVGGGLETFQVVPPGSSGGEAGIKSANDSKTADPFLYSLDVGEGFAAAVATLGRPGCLRAWNLDGLYP